MTELPQGFNDPVKKPDSSKSGSTTVLPTLRKRWNTPDSPKTDRMNPPLLKRNSIPSVPNTCKNKTAPWQSKSSVNVSKFSSPGKLPDCSNKSISKVKESQIELATLRKEVCTLKSENSILRARVRRVEDENTQRTRQIDKLQTEIKTELVNNKRNKENESMLLLRQKCLRLESAFKEKDQVLKRLIADLTRIDELKEVILKHHKELRLPNGIGGEIFQNIKNNNNKVSIQPAESKTSFKQGRLNLNHQQSKTETDKLRGIIHKLEAENKYLQAHVKQKDQEIRRLKLQFPHGNTSGSTTKLNRRASTPRASSPTQSKSLNTSSSHLAVKKPIKTTSSPSLARPPPQIRQTKTTMSRATRSSLSPKNSTFVIKESRSILKQKPNSRKSSVQETEKNQLEQKVQNMRENVAARKIQKGWRHHKQMAKKDVTEDLNKDTTEDQTTKSATEDQTNIIMTKEQEKALNIILEHLKAHQLHKEKLIICSEENSDITGNLPENMSEIVATKLNSALKTVHGNFSIS